MVVEFLASREGRSRSTVATYGSSLETLFVPFCDREGVSSYEDLTPALIDRFEREVNRLTHVTKGSRSRGRPGAPT